MKNFFKIMMALAVVCLPLAFVSCSDDDDDNTPKYVSYEVTSDGTSGMTTDQITTLQSVMAVYQTAVNKAIGGEKAQITTNDDTQYDNTVKSACYTVEDEVKANYTDFKGTIRVKNSRTKKEVYKYSN